MNLFSIALIIVVLPVILQIIFGSLSIKKSINWNFGYMSLLTCVGQFLAIFLSLKIIEIDAQNQNVKCGMPQAAMFVLGLFSLTILLATIIIQVILRRNIKKNMESTVLLENGESIKLPRKVVKSKQFGNVVVVLTDSNENDYVNNENVYCYDFNGDELWQIEDLNLFHEKHDYISIYLQDSELYIYNRCGVEVKIVPETGKILSKELIK